ncbi:AraC family transcriptional regulator [Mycobacterium montefiorense]|uniref:AraC family transcriptional regulator n=1 Tax=Mycobacterium montefiorense TaxID=154654 RepID=A0AA37PL31_9MYCO|nr:AraC family transcriptional regulator [Mycobacterium montefiorense]GBG36496.1 AraC family transcriptional regulator [Mycobacterium montefiorense]GKU37234.1 AraC family transcriptional regulator [Mycobacterium montefiorense]GKU43249.1 AraC family transcriptional regulator [Mycobacterium montefiorense]GKU44016.1 AraC family transcriptional regulator [Mycobacterium montefiorense]GKU53776.1 AraC family transcriptional regulator [Mycobacterium montefiorense]
MLDGLRLRIDTSDPEDARAQIASVYCPHSLTVKGSLSAFRARHAEGGNRGLGVYSLSYGSGTTLMDSSTFDDFVLVSQQISGQFAVRAETGERLVLPGEHVVVDAHTAYRLRWEENCNLFHARIRRTEFENAVAEFTGASEPAAVRFPLSWRPSKPRTATVAKVMQFLLRNAGPNGLLASRALLSAQMRRILVASIVEAYPGIVHAVDAGSSGGVRPPAVRRAVAYLEVAAAEDVRISDVAAAARLSTRALQDAFRKHLDTTPMSYLKSIRLARAHADLRQASVEDGVTVAAVAYQWGFGNLGRFSADYRREFGRLPSEVLRAPR